jgi:hypothetical protein
MDRRTSGAIVLGVLAAALTVWFARRYRRATDLYVAPRAEWTPPHGDPLAEGRL